MKKHNRELLLTAGFVLLMLFFFISKADAAEIQQFNFPITVNVPHVWEWQLIKEDTPSGEPDDFFILRHFKAPEGKVPDSTIIGLTISLRDVPELGTLYQIWNIKLKPNGNYDFGSAVYAHRLDDNQWFVAPTGFIIKTGLGPTDAVSVIVYRRVFSPKLGEREKVVVEYRILYSRLAIKSVFFKVFDPAAEQEKPIYFELKLNNATAGEKIIEKERRLK